MKTRETIGVILLNLGGPDSLQAVRPFLYNLFSDREIIRLGPSFLQKPLAWLISSIRSKKTERFYSLIGGKSPILEITMAQAKALEEALNQVSGVRCQVSPPLSKGGIEGGVSSELVTPHSSLSFRVYIGMRYWHPLIEEVVPEIYNAKIKKLIALSLYPQYSVATTGSSFSNLREVIGSQFTVHCITSWFNHPLYIEALVDVIKKGIESFTPSLTLPPRGGVKGGGDVHILFSAHSLPRKFIEEGDPYLNHINATITAVNSLLVTRYALRVYWHLSYQSKGGPVKWLEPSTDEKLRELAYRGIKNILVVPISFVSDHIETLYEIDILYKEIAEKLGINLRRTESLNTHPVFIEALKDIVIKNSKELGWLR